VSGVADGDRLLPITQYNGDPTWWLSPAGTRFTDRELVTSHVAAKVNGYIGGYGTLQQFERDSVNWQLSEAQNDALKKVIARGGVHASCGL